MKGQNLLPDEQLVKLYMEGESDALSALVLRYKEKLLTSIYLIVKDRFLAEDIFQEVFIKVIDTLRKRQYTDEGKFLPWTMRIAHNLCVDHFRKIKRQPVIKTSENYDIFETLNFSETSAVENIVAGENKHTIRKMLNSLPVDQCEVIVLRHFGGLNFKEIANITKCSINTALGRMRYGLINLRKMMAENEIAF